MRDESLPLRYRLHALGTCIHLVRPIGFDATWSYLEEKVERSWRETEFALPPLAFLERFRATHHLINQQFAEVRRSEKELGHRSPAQDAVTPSSPLRWHGDERVAARHGLAATWRRPADPALARHPEGAVVLASVERALTTGTATSSHAELERCLAWARRETGAAAKKRGSTDDRVVASSMIRLLGHLHVACFGAPHPGSTWHFTSG